MKKVSIIFILLLSLLLTGCANIQSKAPQVQPGTSTTEITGSTGANNSTPSTATGTTQQKIFTVDELKKYNGKNGNPAYVAVNGLVYDVTNSRLWKNGLHSECSDSTYAGADFSKLINQSPHGTEIMKRLKVVGTLKK